jgi:hypothetical protein
MYERRVNDDGIASGSGPWVVILTSATAYEARAAWIIPEGEATARRFANFITAERDEGEAAVALPLRSPVGELLDWRREVVDREDAAVAAAFRSPVLDWAFADADK